MDKSETQRLLKMLHDSPAPWTPPTYTKEIIREKVIPKEIVVKEVKVPHPVEKVIVREVPVIRTVHIPAPAAPMAKGELASMLSSAQSILNALADLSDRVQKLEAALLKPRKVTKVVYRDDRDLITHVDSVEVTG